MKKKRRVPRVVRRHKLRWDRGEGCWYCPRCDEYGMIADFRTYECPDYVPPPPPAGERGARSVGEHARVSFEEEGNGDDYSWAWSCAHCHKSYTGLKEMAEAGCPIFTSIPSLCVADIATAAFTSGRAEELRRALSEEAEAAWRLTS